MWRPIESDRLEKRKIWCLCLFLYLKIYFLRINSYYLPDTTHNTLTIHIMVGYTTADQWLNTCKHARAHTHTCAEINRLQWPYPQSKGLGEKLMIHAIISTSYRRLIIDTSWTSCSVEVTVMFWVRVTPIMAVCENNRSTHTASCCIPHGDRPNEATGWLKSQTRIYETPQQSLWMFGIQ